MNNRLLMVGSDNPTTWIVYNRLVREFGPLDIIIEEQVPRAQLLRNRARKLGWLTVAGQMAFVALIRPVLQYQSAKRRRILRKRLDLEEAEPLTDAIRHVGSINSPEAIAMISEAAPDIVIVNGTRILKPQVLGAVKATFLNTHQGITPNYRGANGAYWALYQDDAAHCGVTVHLVDEGIDTGNIVGQALIKPEPQDCYTTYPLLQTAAALPILTQAIRDAQAGRLKTRSAEGPSAVWYHPSIWQYVAGRLRGVR